MDHPNPQRLDAVSTRLELLLLSEIRPVFVSVAADDVVLEQNEELRDCLAGRLVARREVTLSACESDTVGFYALPPGEACRSTVLKWFWSAEQLRLIVCGASLEFFHALPYDMLFELASCSDMRMPGEVLADRLRDCVWSAFDDKSEGHEALILLGAVDR